MADAHPTNGDGHLAETQKKPAADGESAYGASTLMTDVEKQRPGQAASGTKRPGNLFRSDIDTNAGSAPGLDPVYVAKAQLLNEALLDIGMGRHQWFLLIVTAVGWFLDEVSNFSPSCAPPPPLPTGAICKSLSILRTRRLPLAVLARLLHHYPPIRCQ